MGQARLFDIEPIESELLQSKPIRTGAKRIGRRRKEPKPLMDKLNPDVKKKPILICRQPYTVRYVPYNFTKKQIKAYIAKHFDEHGRFICQPHWTELHG